MTRTFPESAPDLAAIAQALADPTRAMMCICLMDGRAWTATELAQQCEVGKSTATAHLHTLVGAGLFNEVRQGRHRYVRLASTEVAELIEQLGVLSRSRLTAAPSLRVHVRDKALLEARTCYKHLAGRFGLDLAEALTARGWIDAQAQPTTTGRGALAARWGLDVAEVATGGRVLSRWCLDWTERRHHVAGWLGDALCALFLDRGWVTRIPESRALRITDAGRGELDRLRIVDSGQGREAG